VNAANVAGQGTCRAPGRRALVAAAGALAVLPACGGRQLTAQPDPAPSTATWAVVWVAAVAAAAVLGLLVTMPAWVDAHRHRWVGILLGVQTGGLLVGAVTVTGVAVRSQQLIGRPPEQLPEVALLELSAIGDGGFVGVILVGVLLFLVLPAVVTGLSARLAVSDRAGDRWVACVVLSLQAGAGLIALGWALAAGGTGLLGAGLVVNAPLAGLAVASCAPVGQQAGPRPASGAPIRA
jgi:hypothetical protein